VFENFYDSDESTLRSKDIMKVFHIISIPTFWHQLYDICKEISKEKSCIFTLIYLSIAYLHSYIEHIINFVQAYCITDAKQRALPHHLCIHFYSDLVKKLFLHSLIK
jgi:hypothetical protein